MKYVTGFLFFWYDFIVGDAWEVAAGVVAALAIAWLLVRTRPDLTGALGPLLVVVVVAGLSASVLAEQRRRR